jgi:hypothetical protein
MKNLCISNYELQKAKIKSKRDEKGTKMVVIYMSVVSFSIFDNLNGT